MTVTIPTLATAQPHEALEATMRRRVGHEIVLAGALALASIEYENTCLSVSRFNILDHHSHCGYFKSQIIQWLKEAVRSINWLLVRVLVGGILERPTAISMAELRLIA